MRLFSAFLGIFLMSLSFNAYGHSSRDLVFVDDDGSEIIIHSEDIEALPQHVVETTTPWHEGVQKFEGPLLRDLVALLEKDMIGINAVALNDFSSDVPKEDYLNYDVVFAWKHNGKEMSRRELGPYFIVYPYDHVDALQDKIYYSRSVWQIVKIRPFQFKE